MQLFTKNIALCKHESGSIGVTPARCRKVKVRGSRFELKPRVNGGGNYNRPKVAEIPCLVSSDPHEWRNDMGTVSTKSSVKVH